MAWNLKQETSDGTLTVTDDAGGKPNPAVSVGRGATDNDITFITLRTSDGTLAYIYPNTAGNAITVSTSKP